MDWLRRHFSQLSWCVCVHMCVCLGGFEHESVFLQVFPLQPCSIPKADESPLFPPSSQARIRATHTLQNGNSTSTRTTRDGPGARFDIAFGSVHSC